MRLSDLLALRSVPAAGVYLSLTRRCPLHCAHCSTRSTMRSEQHGGERFLALVDSFSAEDRPAAVLMTGGEALLRPRLVAAIADRCRAVGVATEVTTGAWFAARRRIPQTVEAALRAVDGVAVSMDEWHQAEVPVEDVVWLLDRLAGWGMDVSVQLTRGRADDPWAAGVEQLLAARFGGRVPVLGSLLAPVGRAAAWAEGTDGPPAGGGCDLATWPVVAFDGTIVACCSQRTVDGPVPAHLRLGQAGRDGWAAPAVQAGFALAAVAAAAFVLAEHRSRAPMLPLGLFRVTEFRSGTLVGLLINLGFYGQLFVMSLYFQDIRGYPALRTGLALLPEAALLVIGSTLSGRIMARTGPRTPMLAGLLAGAAGLGGIAAAVTTAPYPVLAVAMGTAGFGMSMVMPAATAAVMEAAPPDRGGIASGVINAARQAGGVLGVALLGTLVPARASFAAGLQLGVALSAGAFLLGAVLTATGVPRHHDDGGEQC